MRLTAELEQEVADAGARVRFGFPWWLRPFLFRGVVGITLGRHVYFASEFPENQLDCLLRHEIVHVRQITRVGAIRFYLRYVIEYVRNLRSGMTASEAYENISFEREAVIEEKRDRPPSFATSEGAGKSHERRDV